MTKRKQALLQEIRAALSVPPTGPTGYFIVYKQYRRTSVDPRLPVRIPKASRIAAAN